jgi:hypothetical protein
MIPTGMPMLYEEIGRGVVDRCTEYNFEPQRKLLNTIFTERALFSDNPRWILDTSFLSDEPDFGE